MWANRIVGHGTVAPQSLNAHPANWRLHGKVQRQALATALDRVGWVQDVIVNRTTGRMIDGHLRVALALERGEPEIPVLYVALDETEESLMLATLDPIAALAGTDDEVLARLLGQLEAEDAAVQELLRTVAEATGVVFDEPADGRTDPDALPELARTIVSRTGDLWQLGEHRILCGDATAEVDVQRLFGSERAQWLWTDPPYGVDYAGGTSEHLTIANDDAAGLPALLASAFAQADRVLAPGSPIYCAAPAGRLFLVFGRAFEDAGWHLHQTLVWLKDSLVLGHSDYQYRHEPLLYGWKPPGRRWFAGRAETSVFECPRPQASPEHPTVKPVALAEAQLRNSSLRGALGYDPFLGSGSTLLAAERLGRRCYGLELEPRYTDVAVRRWQTFAGREAVLAGDGRSFSALEAVRRGG